MPTPTGRAVAVFASEEAAMHAAESLLGQKYVYEDVEVEWFAVQYGGEGAQLDGSAWMIWRHEGQWTIGNPFHR